jgi:glycosyltransferase involved in cell wall biosynthesis
MGNPDAVLFVGAAGPGGLTMSHIVHLSSVHDALYSRLFHRKCRASVEAGHSVTVIASHPRSCRIDGVQVIAVKRHSSKILRMTLTALDVFRKAKNIPADLYHIEDPELLPWAVLLRWWTGSPVIYDSMEYHRQAILWKDWIPRRLRPLIAASTEKIEKLCVRQLDGVIVVNHHMKGLFDPYCPCVTVVHNFPWQSSLPEIAGSRDPNMMIYLGSFSRERGYELLLDSLELIRKEDRNAYCAVVGSVIRQGMSSASLKKERALAGQGTLRLVSEVEYKDIWRYLLSASIGLIPFLHSPNTDMGLPNKLFEYMGAALPIVAPRLRFLSSIVEQAGCGILVPAGTPKEYASAILTLLRDPQLRSDMGERGRRAILAKYNFETEASAMLALYGSVLGHPFPGTVAVSRAAQNKAGSGLPGEASNVR